MKGESFKKSRTRRDLRLGWFTQALTIGLLEMKTINLIPMITLSALYAYHPIVWYLFHRNIKSTCLDIARKYRTQA